MKKEKTIGELINDYRSSSCYNIHYFLLKSRYIRYVFEDNFRELLKHINKYEREIFSKRQNFKEKKLTGIKSHNYLKKFIKYFHNYVAVVYSVEGHCDKFLPTRGSMRGKFDVMKREPLRLFIFALRNNITHYTIPPISISVKHKKRTTSHGEVLFLTKGHFKVSKTAILSDNQNAQPTRRSGQSNSEFLIDDIKRNILCAYISRRYKNSSSINLKDVVIKHHKMFLKYINKIDSELIGMNKTGYCETERLYKEIIKRQSML